MIYKFSKSSESKLLTIHPDLRRVVIGAMEFQVMDFTVTEGYRSQERQNKLFKQGRTKIDGIEKLGNHNRKPSLAVDLAPYPFDLEDENIWDVNGQKRFFILAGVMFASARECGVKIRWGGDWDSDFQFTDQRFHDMPHFELV